jgi:haloalkane dehalogenase
MEAPRPTWLPERLFPFRSRYLELLGHRVHFVDEGLGPTLLMLHGNPTWSFLYRGIIRRLSDRYRCVALDYPGFGLSRAAPGYDFRPASHAAVVEAFIAARNLGPLTLFVQDWGGPIGLWVAGCRPELIEGLVVGNSWAWPIDGDPHFERFSAFFGGRVGRFLIRRLNLFVNLLLPLGVRRRRLSREVMRCYRRPLPTPLAREVTHVFPREIRASSAFLGEVNAGLARLRDKPALLLWGDRDIAFRNRELRRFERELPRSKTVILEGAGHFIQEDAAPEIADHLRSFMRQEVGFAENIVRPS